MLSNIASSPSQRRALGHTSAGHPSKISQNNESIKEKIQQFADKTKKDVESALNSPFTSFSVIEYTASCNRSHNTEYSMRVKVDDSRSLRVRLIAMDPSEDWTIKIEEYEAFQSTSQSIEAVSSCSQDLSVLDQSFKSEIKSISEYIKMDVDVIVGSIFASFDAIEYFTFYTADVTFYHIRIAVDNNATIKVKLTPKAQDKTWNLEVKEYDKSDGTQMEPEGLGQEKVTSAFTSEA